LFLGGVAHPVHLTDSLSKSVKNIVGQLFVTRLCFGAEILLHIKLAERETQIIFFLVEHPFPTRSLIRCAVENGAVKMKIFIIKRTAQLRSVGVDELPSQIGLPMIQALLLEGNFDLLEEFRLANNYGIEIPDIACRQITLPANR